MWDQAAKSDRRRLQQFTCTTDPERDAYNRPFPHPRPWEKEVQSSIRTLHLPAKKLNSIRIRSESADDPISAVVSLRQEAAPDVFHLQLIAVSLDLRKQGGAVADEAFTEASQECAAISGLEQGATLFVTANIHSDNQASIYLAERNLMERTGIQIAGDYEEWLTEIVI